MSGSQEVTANATLDDSDTVASNTGDALARQIFTHLDPTATFGSGSVNIGGFYNCGSTYTTSSVIIIGASQDNSSTNVAAGTAAVPVSTCNGANQAFSVTISSGVSGGSFSLSSSAVAASASVDVVGSTWMGPSIDWEEID